MKSVLITGGASGIGAATVRYYLDQQWQVFVMDAQPRPSFIKEPCVYVQADVSVRSEVDAAMKHLGPIDAVVACAGIYVSNSIDDLKEEEWRRVMDTNCYGVINVVQAAMPALKKSASPSIVLVASDQVFALKKKSLAYAASKGAVAQMAKSMALDLAPARIRVNAICPGTTKTPMTETFVNQWAAKEGISSEQCWAQIAQEYPLGRVGQPEDIAPLIYFLTSPEASFITGALIPVDGGLTV